MNCAPDDEYEDIEDAIEQDVLMAFLAADCDITDKAVCEEIAECIHTEYTAFVAREQAHSRGVPLQRSIHSFHPPPSELTLQQRRDKIAIAKKTSTCRNCHKPGHWAAECPEKKHHPHGKPKPLKKKLRGY